MKLRRKPAPSDELLGGMGCADRRVGQTRSFARPLEKIESCVFFEMVRRPEEQDIMRGTQRAEPPIKQR